MDSFIGFDDIVAQRKGEADAFYAALQKDIADEDIRRIQRQAFAGMLWSKQFYDFNVRRWLDGDPLQPPPPENRKDGRNSGWRHLLTADIIAMPDKWEYPWFAAWDLAVHCVTLSLIDPDFAKAQLLLLCEVRLMHPNGQLPAYEWAFGDVNPPVHAWAAMRVFQNDRNQTGGSGDFEFLERVFHKLLLNFTWWVNRKDPQGMNIFEGGFLGLDNIGVFDRSRPLPTGGYIEQADGTAWMAMFCLIMLRIAIELTPHNDSYEDIASKFFEHFLYIASAVNRMGDGGLWDEQDGFYYDWLRLPDGNHFPMRVRSLVGLIPLFAVTTIDTKALDQMKGFKRRMEWFIKHRPDLCGNIASITRHGMEERTLLSMVHPSRLRRILKT